MKIFRNKIELDNHLGEIRKKGREIGLIPTMGSIHKGHKSLVEKCIEANFFSLATIYINPTQFDNKSDFENYPCDEKKDIFEKNWLIHKTKAIIRIFVNIILLVLLIFVN